MPVHLMRAGAEETGATQDTDRREMAQQVGEEPEKSSVSRTQAGDYPRIGEGQQWQMQLMGQKQ